jgi:uncharacterized protein with HEPN domain
MKEDRKLGIIGEAAKKLSEQTKSQQAHVQWKQIAGMRDRLIHNYFGVNLEIVWTVIEKDLPILRKATDELLEAAQ